MGCSDPRNKDSLQLHPRHIKCLILLFILLLTTVSTPSVKNSISEELSNKARSFLETQLTVINSTKSELNTRPIQYWVRAGSEIDMNFTAEKFMTYLNGKMFMKIFLPQDIAYVAGDVEWQGTDKKKSLLVQAVGMKIGDYLVNATATNLDMNFTTTSRILIHVRDTIDNPKFVTESQSAEPLPTQKIVDANAQKSAKSAPPANYAWIHGVVYTYPYSDGKRYMLRGVQIELWENIALWPDQRIGNPIFTVEASADDDYGLTPKNYVKDNIWYHVDDSGSFDFGNVYVGSGGKDLYFKVVYIFHDGGDGRTSGGTEKLVIRDRSTLLDDIIVVTYTTSHYSSGQDSGIIGLPAPSLSSNNSQLGDEAAHTFYDMVKTYSYFERLVGFSTGHVTVYIDIPSTGAPNSVGDKIYLNGWTDPDSGYIDYEGTDIIIHEYSHSIHWYMRGDPFHPFPPLAPGDTNHGGLANSDSADALTEGWADFVPTAINKDPKYHWYSANSYVDMSENSGIMALDEKVEWTFAAILWDLRGDIGSDAHVWFYRIATTLNNYDPNYVKTFHDKFISDWDNNQIVWQIFKNHNVNYDNNPPSNPSSYSSNPASNVWTNDNTIDVTWYGATDDLSGIDGYWYRWTKDTYGDPTGYYYTTGTSVTSPALADGYWYLNLRSRDKAGNNGSGYVYCGPFKIDKTSPNAPSISADSSHSPPNTWTTHNSPYFTWSNPGDTGSGVSYYEGSINDGAPFTVSSPYHPTWSDGTYTFKVRAVDGAGMKSGWSNAITVKIDTTPPVGSIRINDGAAYTKSTSVTLSGFNPVDTSGVTEMRFRNEGGSWSSWEPYTPTSKPWTLPSGDGSKRVYVQFKDYVGLVSSESQLFDDITLDTTPPSTPTLSSPADGTKTDNTKPTFTWNAASDSTSGIASYTFQIDTSSSFNSANLKTITGITTTSYTPSTPLAGSKWYWRVCAVDNAGNTGSYSSYRSITITVTCTVTLDSSPRVASITVNGTTYTTSQLPKSFTLEGGSTLVVSVSSPIAGGTGKQYVFTSWSDGNTSANRTITVSASVTYTASYKTQHQFSVTSSGLPSTFSSSFKYGTSTPPQTSQTVVGASTWTSGWYDQGTTIYFEIDPNSQTISDPSVSGKRYTFASWSQSSPLTLNGYLTLTARYKTQYLVTVGSSPSVAANVYVDSSISPSGVTPCGVWVDGGTRSVRVESTAALSGASYIFSSWTGDATGTSNPISISIPSPKTITANYQWAPWQYSRGGGGTLYGVAISSDGTYIAVVGQYSVFFFKRTGASVVQVWNYTLSRSGSSFYNLAMSADGNYLVVGGSDLTLFSRASSTPVWTTSAYGYIYPPAISSDGSYIVAGTTGNKLRLWSRSSNVPIWNCTARSYFGSVAISSDGNYIAAADGNNNIYAFSRASNAPLWNYTTPSGFWASPKVSISSDGNYIGAGRDKLYLFSRSSSVPIWTYTFSGEGERWGIDHLLISSDSNRILCGSYSTTALFSRSSNTPLWVNNNHRCLYPSMSSDGSHMVTAPGSRMLLYSASSSSPVWEYSVSPGSSYGTAMSSDGNYIAAIINSWAPSYNRILLFNRSSSAPIWTYDVHSAEMRYAAVSSSGDYIAASDNGGKVYLLGRSSSAPLWVYDTKSSPVGWGVEFGRIAISSDGSYVVAGTDKVYLLSRSGNLVWTHGSATPHCAISSDGRYVVTYGSSDWNNWYIYQFSTASSTPAWTYLTNGSRAYSCKSLSISADGQFIAAVIVTGDYPSYFSTLYVFSRSSSTPLWTYRLNVVASTFDPGGYATVSSDGNYIAATVGYESSSKVYLFSRSSNSPIWTYNCPGVGFSYGGNAPAAIVSDGSYLVSSTGSGNFSLFRKTSNSPVWTYNLSSSSIQDLTISSDGRYIVMADSDGIVYIFGQSSSTPIRTYNTGSRVFEIAVSLNGNSIAVTNRQPINSVFLLTPSLPSLNMRITDWDGMPVKDLVIRIYDSSGALVCTHSTNSTGYCPELFLNSTARYTVRVYWKGYLVNETYCSASIAGTSAGVTAGNLRKPTGCPWGNMYFHTNATVVSYTWDNTNQRLIIKMNGTTGALQNLILSRLGKGIKYLYINEVPVSFDTDTANDIIKVPIRFHSTQTITVGFGNPTDPFTIRWVETQNANGVRKSSFSPGEFVYLNVSIRNTGLETWASPMIVTRLDDPNNAPVYIGVSIPASVGAGENYTTLLGLSLPQTSGTYKAKAMVWNCWPKNCSWRALAEASEKNFQVSSSSPLSISKNMEFASLNLPLRACSTGLLMVVSQSVGVSSVNSRDMDEEAQSLAKPCFIQ